MRGCWNYSRSVAFAEKVSANPAGRSKGKLVAKTQAGVAAELRVVVVEDEPLIRWMISDELRDLGFNVSEFSTADDAWGYILSGSRVDVVFTDIRLPGTLNGLELAHLIEAEAMHVKAVVITSSHLPQDACSFKGRFIAKPYNHPAVATLLMELAQGEDLAAA